MTETRKGEIFIIAEAMLWAFFPVITVLSYAKLPSLVSLAGSASFATVFFFLFVTVKKKWHEVMNRTLWLYVAVTTGILAVAFYALYFIGLESTTPGNAALIAEMEMFTSLLFFTVLRREPISRAHALGLVLMFIGACIVLAPNFSSIHVGDFLVLAAVVISPVGNMFTQKARKIASAESIMFLRSLLSIPCILLLAVFLHQSAPTSSIIASLGFLAVNGILLFGLSKILWIEAIHRISVTKAAAINGITPLLTLLIAWWLLAQAPTVWQLAAFVPLTVGILLLTDQIPFKVARPV